jgi:DNA replication licensing factor MCM2
MDGHGRKRRIREVEEDERNGSDDEAIEDRDIDMDQEDLPPEDEEEGEDLMENPEDDYKEIKELDRYDTNDLDDGEYSNISARDRQRAEKLMDIRDRGDRAFKSRVPAAMLEGEGSEMSNELDMRGRNMMEAGVEDDWEEEEDEERYLDLDEMRGKLATWIADPKTVRYIKKSFKRFLQTFKDNDESLLYQKRIQDMCSRNSQSLDITYIHLTNTIPTIAYWIFETPAIILPHLNATAFELACKQFPGYQEIHSEIYVRIRDFPLEEKIRDLRTFHLNTLIKIVGVVTRRYPVYSQLKKIFYICQRCGMRMGPIYQNENQDFKIGGCAVCASSGPFSMDTEMAVYRNYQRITVQESPGTVLPGRVPRYKDVILFADNIDCARPGDEIEIVGIYTNKYDYGMNVKHGFPVFNTVIEANSVRKLMDMQMSEITTQEKEEIQRLARRPDIHRIIINSIAPSIYGHFNIKTALALSMFGGEAQNINGSHRIRGDINVLLLGDPGLAKSQFLKYVEKTFHRTVYTTGKGASAVGLTASVRRDFSSKEWTLEGGAMVLADQGICLIDEFDKMSEMDRTSIHEAMEQQSISISKAGIVANLQARCAVIAAANPIKGRYDPQLSFADNVNLSEPILSRFDILCVLRDEVEPTKDSDLASFIINSHIMHHPNFDIETE